MPLPRVTPVVRVLLIVNIALFLIQMVGDTFLGTHILEAFALVPYLVFHKFYFWQLFTYMFMHADIFHILFNMLVVWWIGAELEATWGQRFFIIYYVVCGLSGGLFYTIIQALFGGGAAVAPMVGSSGAVYGLLVAYGIIFANRVLLFMMLFPMKAKHFVLVLAGVEFVSTVFNSRGGVANAAHLGGMIVGFGFLFFTAYLRMRARTTPGSPRRKMSRKHLRLVVNNKDAVNDFEQTDDDSDKPTFH